MSKYQTLDALILERVSSATCTAHRIPVPFALISANPKVEAESERLAQIEKEGARGRSTAPGWRIVDRRLQALRKAGKIQSTSKGWVLTAIEHD